MRRGGAGKKRDSAEKPIVEALRAVGAQVWHLNDPDVGDLLIRFRGVLYCPEVKSKGGRLRKGQGDFPVWRTPSDALSAIGAVPVPVHICGRPGFTVGRQTCQGCASNQALWAAMADEQARY